MLKKLYPHEYVESVFAIDYNKLYKKGYKGIIFDVDNTLVHHGTECTKEVEELFKKVHKIGFKTILLTDNDKKRTKKFVENLNTSFICNANKPNPTNFLKAVEKLKVKKENIIYIGDQMLLDTLGANRAGIDNILVKYMRYDTETKIGKKRTIEKFILKFYFRNKKYSHRIGDILLDEFKPLKKQRKLFCDINPICYAISENKEILKRHIKNFLSKEKIAKTKSTSKLPNLVYQHHLNMIKRAPGVDLTLQENKAINIDLACKSVNGLIIKQGETFSMWKTVGKPSKRRGYKEGRIIKWNKLVSGIGGGLCNFGNTIHILVLHSPLKVVEFHKHSDALSPDEGKRFPLSAGTSVSYNALDFRFKNNTDQNVQLFMWCEGEEFFAELRSEKEFPYVYEIYEEDHHFQKEGKKYYRCSKIYRSIKNRKNNKTVNKELILDNHSEVMYDYNLIPKDLIK